MDLRPSQEQTQLVEAFAAMYGKSCSPGEVADGEHEGHHPALWVQVQQMGAVEMAVDDGATLLDLVLVAEQHGRHIAPAPMIEAQVAARLLSAVGGPLAEEALASLLAGDELITIALRPPVGGIAGLVPAGAVADRAIVASGDRLLLVNLDGTSTPVSNTGGLPLADVAVPSDAHEIANGHDALLHFALALDEWRVLTAAALQGLAARALEIGVEYVKERKAFGQPIGAFQAVAHRLADRAAEVDGAELLIREAAWSFDAEPLRAPELAAMALAFAAETARDTTYFALHFHGGYGFMLEYPIQAYFRRARTWSAILENPATSFQLVAERRALRVAKEAAK
ncbi:MAG: acyl-CoA dehydrogenase family protein [Mycobacterium sp.]